MGFYNLLMFQDQGENHKSSQSTLTSQSSTEVGGMLKELVKYRSCHPWEYMAYCICLLSLSTLLFMFMCVTVLHSLSQCVT